MRTLPPGIDQRSASRHPDWVGPDDLRIKIEELREATGWEKPIYVKFGATRVANDVKLAVEAGADVVVVDGMQGGTAATQDFFIEHTGIPTLAAVRLAAEALREIGMEDTVQLSSPAASATAPTRPRRSRWARTRSRSGVAPLIALGCNSPTYWQDGAEHDAAGGYRALGTEAGYCHHCHTGRCPVGVTTQDAGAGAAARPGPGRPVGSPTTSRRWPWRPRRWPGPAASPDVHNLEPEDLVALTVEAAAMAQVPLAGTDWIPGHPKGGW